MRVIDGDTLLVRARIWLDQSVETRVRLAGIDTPEKRGLCDRERGLGRQAEEAVSQYLGDERRVYLTDVTADKYGRRVIARVQTEDGRDLGETLTEAGLAIPYDGGRKEKPWCP